MLTAENLETCGIFPFNARTIIYLVILQFLKYKHIPYFFFAIINITVIIVHVSHQFLKVVSKKLLDYASSYLWLNCYPPDPLN